MLDRVAIIGGGPAGCSAALWCSQLGLGVVLFEAGDRYRDKPCGDALLASAVAHARAFGLTESDFIRLGGRPFEGIDLVLTQHRHTPPRQLNSRGWVIPRASLDQALRDVVSQTCEVRYGTVVRDLLPTSSGVSLTASRSPHRTEQFGAAILATGASARLSRALGIDGRPSKGLAFRSYIPEPRDSSALLFEVTSVEPIQYRWSFPLDGGANVGLCRLDRYTVAVKAELHTLANSYRIPKFKGGVEPLWSGSEAKWHHAGGVVSCGDAAGLVDPITGEGITAAFKSGEIAARAIADYLGGQGAVALVNYSSQIYAVFSVKYETDRRMNILRQESSSGTDEPVRV